MADGFRESTQSWREVLLDLKRRGLADPEVGHRRRRARLLGGAARSLRHDAGAALLGAQDHERAQRAAQSVQAKAKGHLQDIWQAETSKTRQKAFDFFVEAYGVKYDKAVAKLVKDRDVLLTFYDFPAEHWKHIRTTNPIESTFATVRHRTKRTKGCLSRKTGSPWPSS